MKNQLWDCDIMYFKEDPVELIGLSREHYSVRYVYNSQISPNVLNGYATELNEKEKKRVISKVKKTFLPYKCDYGGDSN